MQSISSEESNEIGKSSQEDEEPMDQDTKGADDDNDEDDEEEEEEEDDEDEEDDDDSEEKIEQKPIKVTKPRKPRSFLTGRGVTIAMLIEDGVMEPGEKLLSIDYLVRITVIVKHRICFIVVYYLYVQYLSKLNKNCKLCCSMLQNVPRKFN